MSEVQTNPPIRWMAPVGMRSRASGAVRLETSSC